MLDLRNPYIFAPIKTGYSDGNGTVTSRHLAYYRERSRHVGAVTPEPFYLDARLRELPTQMGIDGGSKVPGLKSLVNGIHAGGAVAIAHLNHPGRMANPKIPGNVFFSSTDRACEAGGAQPTRMGKSEMDEVVDLFVAAARTAVASEFDALELQLGHGYLLAQFLSPMVNDRQDDHGGNFAGRSRFPLRIVDAVLDAVDLPLLVRISGAEMVTGGIEIEEAVALARELKSRDVEAVHVSAGTVCNTPPWYFQHMFVPIGKTWDMAERIHRETGVKVVAVGRISGIAMAKQLEERFAGGFLAVGRALVADPDFVGKVLGQVEGPVRPCLACAEGCLGGVKSGHGLQCLVNPEVGRELPVVEPAETKRRVAVVGGGLTGMQAAITLFDRGHKVDLFEAEQLGGQFNLAPLTPHKHSMDRLVPYLIEELELRNISIIKKRAEASDVLGYDTVVVATGSNPRVPPIPGLEKYRWADILADRELPENQHVLIIGGGLIGVDVATALIPLGNRITIVKRTTDFGEDMELIAKKLSLKIMTDSGVKFSDRTHVKRVDGRTVHAWREEQPMVIEEVDLIVVTTGMASVDDLARELDGAVPVRLVGDAKRVGNAQDAIADAYLTCRDI
ncbi:MAG: FAD-dependent oxidoreductase [Candidatus Krumholzibacteria bacterium]|nr:FAD-dependent oxidoreductase [Candidatus Krumholzibacteria bacterium]